MGATGSLLLSLVLPATVLLSQGAADAARGREIFITHHQSCHSVDGAEVSTRGSHLAGHLDRRYGAAQGRPYRMVRTEPDPHRTKAQLGSNLAIHRLPEPNARADVIAFLVLATAGAAVADPARGEAIYYTQWSSCDALIEERARTVRSSRSRRHRRRPRIGRTANIAESRLVDR